MARGVAIGLLIIGAIALFLLWPFNEPQRPELCFYFKDNFNNEKISLTIDKVIVFASNIKTPESGANKLAAETCLKTITGTNHDIEIWFWGKSFGVKIYRLKVTVDKPLWVVVSKIKEENGSPPELSFEFRYDAPRPQGAANPQ